MSNKKRGFLEMPFGWMFALIVGGIILFMAIYFSIQFIKTERTQEDVTRSREIGIIMNPLEISFEEGKSTLLELPVDTRFYNKCDRYGDFGRQLIEVSQLSLNQWSKTGLEVSFKNKYIFSEEAAEGRSFYVFAKPFEFPFKVADLIYLIPKKGEYCFVNAPSNITQEIKDLKFENIINVTNKNFCDKESRKVCFSGTGCDINVNVNGGRTTRKEGNKINDVRFQGNALMYASIFSGTEIYECQVKRLMLRVQNLAELYNTKAIYLSTKDCDSNINLIGLIQSANDYNSSKQDLPEMVLASNEAFIQNDKLNCRLW
ncbi:MAG TPA: hypothetical protein VJH92_00295 [Candidatus Nanoarchaeia archaeon]|nr:hypothetical protein [Candidatus Nanoarchaeia archaeon]